MRFSDASSFRFRYLHAWILASVAGAGGSILLAALLVPARDWLGNTNVALLLVGVVIAAAAVGGRLAGVITAIAASLAFNAIHTLPYGTLVIEHREDAITTALVAIVGIAVGELTHQRITSARTARRRDYAVARLHNVGELIRQGRPLEEVLEAFQDELAAELGLREVRYEPGLPHRGRPQLRPNATLDSGERIPESGVEVVVHCDGEPVGHLILFPGPRLRVTHAGLVVAVVMAEMLGALLSRSYVPPT